METIREKIVRIALEEATPAPFGKVSDLVTDGTGKRAGWERLKNYFDVACGWTEQHWQIRGKITASEKEITYLQGVQIPNFRVPQPETKPSGVSWCGIFATWVWIKAGLQVKWGFSGITGAKVKLTPGKVGIQPGDVIVMNGLEVHHSIVIEMPSIYDNDNSILTVNGNSGAQSIEKHSKFMLNQVAYYYKVLD